MQAPPEHTPAPQLVPHTPQFAESVVVLTQAFPHLTSGKGQTQPPALQTDPPPQMLPQVPQLALSHWVSMQVFPHSA